MEINENCVQITKPKMTVSVNDVKMISVNSSKTMLSEIKSYVDYDEMESEDGR